jgi:DNA-binding NarL/FixJ family response regulator
MKKRMVLVDDHASIRGMLHFILSRDPRYEVVGEAGNGHDAIKICARTRPDLVILDLMLPELCGSEVIRRLSDEAAAVRILVYSGTANQDLIITALKARPHGFVEKLDTLATLREAIDAVCAGRSYFTPFASALLYDSFSARERSFHLSDREREVLQLIAEGHSTKEIASRLNVAAKTIDNHRSHLMGKLDLHNVADLTRYAVKSGVVSIE